MKNTQEVKRKEGISFTISGEEIRKGMRIPLPAQTGGRHKDRRRKTRQELKVNFKKKGEWQ